jgi:hypothetical protein
MQLFMCSLLTSVTLSRFALCWSRLTELGLANVSPQAPGLADDEPDQLNDEWMLELQNRQLGSLLGELGKLTELKVGKGRGLEVGFGGGCPRMQGWVQVSRAGPSSSTVLTTSGERAVPTTMWTPWGEGV